jgi:predicted nucleic acid-binding protein
VARAALTIRDARPGDHERLEEVQRAGDVPYVCVIPMEEITRGLRPDEDDDAVASVGLSIAAAAVGVGARLATGNVKDFPMRQLQLERWPAGA